VDRFFNRLDTKISLERGRQAPRQDLATEPVDNRSEIDKAPCHRDVGDIHGPDLIGTIHNQIAQEIRIDLVALCRLRGIGTTINRLNPHASHQGSDVKTANLEAFADQKVLKHPASRKRVIEMQFVNPPHHNQIHFRHGLRKLINATAADPQSLRLSRQRQDMRVVNHRFALGNRPAFPSAPDKKSFSKVNSPILACSDLRSTAAAGSGFVSSPNTSAAPSKSCVRHVVI